MGLHSAFNDVLQYPVARRDESVVDNYHGVMVPDPYRWLEDAESAETKEFMDKQMKLAESVLKTCETRDNLREMITKTFDFPKYDAPIRAGDKYFYFHNSGLQPESMLYVQDSLDGKAEVLLDLNALSEDGSASFYDFAFGISEDGKYVAYGTSLYGSDWVTINVLRVHDKTVEPHTLSWTKFPCICWTHDSKGFFYSRYPALEGQEKLDARLKLHANLNQALYYHFLGTDQSEDILCWSDPNNPGYYSMNNKVTEDGKYVFLFICESSDPGRSIYYCDLSSLPRGLDGYRGTNEQFPLVKLVDNFDASYSYVANDDSIFTFLTNKDAPRYKLVRVDLKEPNSWIDVVPEDKKDVIESAAAVNGNQIVVNYMSDVKNVLQIRDLKTGALLHRLPLEIGAVSEIRCRRKDSIMFFGFTSFLIPEIIYVCDLAGEVPDMRIFREATIYGFDKARFEATQVFVPSKDGTAKIPMFIIAKKGLELDGSHPCLLHGYGGFGLNTSPYFSVPRTLLAKHLDFVFCFANIRGGGEYGIEWHKSANLANKQNCFDDFISSAEYLVSAGYTQPSKLGIDGACNGGLLIAACINQRPDLFGCALVGACLSDMLRFHKFTMAPAWTAEYGCSDKEEDFNWLIKYSPLHNVRRPWDKPSDDNKVIQYPASLLLTAEFDDRAVPLHTLKLLATLQYELCLSVEESHQTNPIIARIEPKAGHGFGMSTDRLIDEAADQFSFLAKALGASWVD